MRKSKLGAPLDDTGEQRLLLRRRGAALDEARGEQQRKIRLDHQRLAEGFHHAHQIDRAAAEAAVLGRDRQAGEAHLRELRPGLSAPALAGDDLAPRFKVVALRQISADRVGEQISRARVEGERGEFRRESVDRGLASVEGLERPRPALLLGAVAQARAPGIDLGVVLAGDQVDGVESAHGWESRSGWRW